MVYSFWIGLNEISRYNFFIKLKAVAKVESRKIFEREIQLLYFEFYKIFRYM